MYTASSYSHTFCYGNLANNTGSLLTVLTISTPPPVPRPFVPAVDKQGGALSSMGLVDLPPELQKRAGLIGYSSGAPTQELGVGYCARLVRLPGGS